jgi:hypothetical protein
VRDSAALTAANAALMPVPRRHRAALPLSPRVHRRVAGRYDPGTSLDTAVGAESAIVLTCELRCAKGATTSQHAVTEASCPAFGFTGKYAGCSFPCGNQCSMRRASSSRRCSIAASTCAAPI